MSSDADREELFGITISNMRFETVCERIAERIERGEPGYVVTPNVDHVCLCHRNARFREAYAKAFLVLPDGVPIMWAARALGAPLRQKLSGSDIVPELATYAARKGWSVYFFGGAPGTAEKTAAILQAANPGLKVAGVYCPPYGFDRDPEAVGLAVERIREARPDLCLVALGSPKQELWMHDRLLACEATVMIGIGAAFDFVSGRIRRAPRWIQNCGMEWLWRLLQEPRRLWKRYLVDDMLFFRIFWKEFKQRRFGRARPAE